MLREHVANAAHASSIGQSPAHGFVTCAPTRVLVTGFGAFPGAPRNPTQQMVAALERARPRLARLGVELTLAVLPVSFAGVAGALDAARGEAAADVALHFGFAGRRRRVGVETIARNRIFRLRPDSGGAYAGERLVERGAPPSLRASAPAPRILAALARAGVPAAASHDAGDYLCNQTLFLSLRRSPRALVGFLHVPRHLSRHGRPTRGRTADALADLALAAILAILPVARSRSRARG